ncbi:transcription factor HES-1-B-like [Lineus longissimus]|uniref:transcription factor HES-1-B-like n=1 Tax=Lineus longissimus TaxID=88925 RepID=UPI002B4D3460
MMEEIMEMLQGDKMEKVSTSSSEARKSSKPIMEKRRRARINASLSELKSLLLEVMKKEAGMGSRHSKMEKADILEMTVKHLRQIQRHQFAAAASSDPSVLNKYQMGFNECANEVIRYLSSIEGADVEVRARLLGHLANCITGVANASTAAQNAVAMVTQQPPVQNNPHMRPAPLKVMNQNSGNIPLAPKMPISPQTTEINNNTISSVHTSPIVSQPAPVPNMNSNRNLVPSPPTPRVQIMPSKLPSGELAFVIPGNILQQGQMPSYVIPVYTGNMNQNVTSVSSPPSSTMSTASVSPRHSSPMQSGSPTSSSMSGQSPAATSSFSGSPGSDHTVSPSTSSFSPSTPVTSRNKQLEESPMHHQLLHLNNNPLNIKEEDVWRPW